MRNKDESLKIFRLRTHKGQAYTFNRLCDRQIRTLRIQCRVPSRAEVRLKKRAGGQLFETGEAKTNGGHINE